MEWKRKCLSAMDAEDVFENTGHRTRFKDLLDCYAKYPFFTKGLCKCMYLSAWDNEHFYDMLETLSDMALSHDKDTKEMHVKFEFFADTQKDDDCYIYQLLNTFLDNKTFLLDDTANIRMDILYMIRRALHMSSVIDAL